jgi:uncharacterized protein YkwD
MRPVRLVTVCSLFVLLLAIGGGPAAASPGRSAQMAAAINKVRARQGLPALRTSASLNRSARRFSRRLIRSGRFGHASRVQASGRFRSLGEALGMHLGEGLGIRSTLRLWLRSPAHRAIVLTRSMRWAGVGVAKGRYHRHSAAIWVLQTGRL